ncbi:AraC family transcriptional regulator [Microbulbifer harenosus]|uniref:AraC family transcriptional regulator n=1 Tax=Microbulbifer harenosus TaxID=2576840 RepID=A0ABY2UHV3_9GAMM|nr:AraC family transcriptional regulator [Microbulbifer harenosus]TLM77334.1 AraC family transcriptional regulator [Microbulbifer harenosus]
MATLFRAAALTNYFEVAESLGLNPQPLLGKFGFSRSQLADPEQRIPAAAAISLLEESARASNCDTFGLRMAESRQLADFGAVSLLLTHQRTLRDALQAVVHYEHLLNEGLAISIEDAGKTVIVRDEVVTDPPMSSRHATELAVGALFRLCSALLGIHWQPYSVNFTHEAPDDLQVHRRIFRCKLYFGAEFNGFTCPADSLDFPNPTADASLAQFAERFVDSLPAKSEHSIELDVRKMIFLLLPTGRATIEQVAMTMGMNVRTLQRRLDEADTGFSELVSSVRRELALRHMENPRHSLGRVAELLGYSVPSSFTRWFKTQFGVSPAQWRAKHVKKVG